MSSLAHVPVIWPAHLIWPASLGVPSSHGIDDLVTERWKCYNDCKVKYEVQNRDRHDPNLYPDPKPDIAGFATTGSNQLPITMGSPIRLKSASWVIWHYCWTFGPIQNPKFDYFELKIDPEQPDFQLRVILTWAVFGLSVLSFRFCVIAFVFSSLLRLESFALFCIQLRQSSSSPGVGGLNLKFNRWTRLARVELGWDVTALHEWRPEKNARDVTSLDHLTALLKL